MKFRRLLIAILLSLSTLGSSCVNEGVLVSINLNPIIGRYRIGTNTSFGGTITVKLDSLISTEYKNKIKQGRIYDLKVKVEGDYSGNVSGRVAIQVSNGNIKEVLRFPQTGTVSWSTFHNSQSMLNSSPYLSPEPEGINELLRALAASPLPNITLSLLGALSVAPVPDNLYVTIEVYLQADAELN